MVAKVGGEVHSQLFEQRPGRVRVEGKGTLGEAFVMLDHLGASTSDDDDGGGRGDGKVLAGSDLFGQSLNVRLTGTAEEMADEDDELTRVRGEGGFVEGAERLGGVGSGEDGDVLHGGEGGAVGTVVGLGFREGRVGMEAGEPVVGRDDVGVGSLIGVFVFGGAGGGEGEVCGSGLDGVGVGEDGGGRVMTGLSAAEVHGLCLCLGGGRGCGCGGGGRVTGGRSGRGVWSFEARSSHGGDGARGAGGIG